MFDKSTLMCPYCNTPLACSYIFDFDIGDFRFNISCNNDSCGFGCNSWTYKDLIDNLNRIEQIKKNEFSL